MLQNMRDKTQGLIAGTIAVIIALTFALWGVQNYLSNNTAPAVARVNGKEITQEQVRIAYEQVKRSEMLRFGADFSLDQKMQAQIKRSVLQQLIEQQIVFQAATKMGLGISKRQLLEVVKNMPIFQVDGRFSAGRFQQLVYGLFGSEQEFLNVLERSNLRMQLEKGLVDSAFVLPTEIATLKKIFKQQRDFGYFIVSPASFAKTVKVTTSDVQQYYAQHQTEFLLPEKISVQYLELSANDLLPTAVKVTPEQLKQFYHSHIDAFSTPKKWQVTRVLQPLPFNASAKDGDDARKKLEELIAVVKAKTDLKNIAPGVQVATSWLAQGEISPDFVAQLDKLKDGEVSTPFRTKDGYNLIKVLATQSAKVAPYETVAVKVKQRYEREQLTQAFSDASDRLADLVYINSDSLEPAAKELGLKIQETELFTNENTAKRKGILNSNKIIKAAFSDAVLQQRYNSNLIEVGVGKVVVLRIKNHLPEKVQPLEQVRAIITQKLQKLAMKDSAAKLAAELLKALRSGKTGSQLAPQYGLVWHTIVGAKYWQDDKHSENDKLVAAAFELPQPKVRVGVTSAVVVDLSDSYAVLRLDKVSDDLLDKNNSKSDSFLKSLSGKLGEFDYQSLQKKLMGKAKIELLDEDIKDDEENKKAENG